MNRQQAPQPVVRPLKNFDIELDDSTALDVWGVLAEDSVMDNVNCSGAILHLFKSEGDSEVGVSVVVCNENKTAKYNGNQQTVITDDIVTCDTDSSSYNAMDRKLSEFLKDKFGYEWGWQNPEAITDVESYSVEIEYTI